MNYIIRFSKSIFHRTPHYPTDNGVFNNTPKELFFKIFEKIDFEDLNKLRLISKDFDAVKEEYLLKKKFYLPHGIFIYATKTVLIPHLYSKKDNVALANELSPYLPQKCYFKLPCKLEYTQSGEVKSPKAFVYVYKNVGKKIAIYSGFSDHVKPSRANYRQMGLKLSTDNQEMNN